jgi:PhnB protein
MKVHVYLNFPGNAAEAFEFYRSLFGGELSSHVRFRDMPMEGIDIPEADQDKAMHIALPLGDDNLLMASDALESLGQNLERGNDVYISVHPDTREDADRIFNGLSSGGEVEMPIADQAWGDYFGSCIDKFGVQWMVNHSPQHA